MDYFMGEKVKGEHISNDIRFCELPKAGAGITLDDGIVNLDMKFLEWLSLQLGAFLNLVVYCFELIYKIRRHINSWYPRRAGPDIPTSAQRQKQYDQK